MICHPAAVSAPTYSAHCRAARSASTATRSACVTMPSVSLLLGLRTSARIGIAVIVGTLGRVPRITTAVFAPRWPPAALSGDSSTPGTRAALRLAGGHLDHEAHRP